MKKKTIRNIIIIGTVLIIITIVLIAATALISSGFMNLQENSSAELSKYIERVKKGKLDELSLTIYYMSPDTLTNMPVSVKDLKENDYELKVTVDGKRLQEHTDLLEQLSSTTLTPVEEQGSDGFARIYYVFETKNNRNIYDVCMWNGIGDIFVNGVEFEAQDIFYDVIMPFLPENEAEELEEHINR